MTRTYSELRHLNTFEDRYEYLRLSGIVGAETFGFDRYLNQAFYRSYEWRKIRDEVILRDNGCDLGIPDRELFSHIYIHHMNPISIRDIDERNPDILNPNYLICCSQQTHNAIHYGDSELLVKDPIVRCPNDTCPWRK